MGLREYVIPGNGRDITVKLTEEDAKRLGDKAVHVKKAEQVKPEVEAKEAEKPANKARTARNK